MGGDRPCLPTMRFQGGAFLLHFTGYLSHNASRRASLAWVHVYSAGACWCSRERLPHEGLNLLCTLPYPCLHCLPKATLPLRI
jgi:hypothetical protein